ncbi:MAG: ABC transporter permease [Thermomicrobiales bacterium]
MATIDQFDLAPAASRHYLIGMIPVLLRRQARIWLQFRVSSVMDILSMMAQASVFFFVGRAVGGTNWSGSYAGFLAVGMIVNTLLQVGLAGPYDSLSRSYWEARLESFLLSPCPITLQIGVDIVWMYVNALASGLFLAIIGASFGARLSTSIQDIVLAAGVILLATIAVLGIGFMSASMFTLINAKGFNDPISWVVGVLQGLVAGAYFPPSELPGPLHTLALFLPQTYAIDAVRRLLLDDDQPLLAQFGSLSPLATDLVILSIATSITVTLGAVCFRLGLRKARADGALSRWA